MVHLNPDVYARILAQIDNNGVPDVAAFSRTCRTLRSLGVAEIMLRREVHLWDKKQLPSFLLFLKANAEGDGPPLRSLSITVKARRRRVRTQTITIAEIMHLCSSVTSLHMEGVLLDRDPRIGLALSTLTHLSRLEIENLGAVKSTNEALGMLASPHLRCVHLNYINRLGEEDWENSDPVLALRACVWSLSVLRLTGATLRSGPSMQFYCRVTTLILDRCQSDSIIPLLFGFPFLANLILKQSEFADLDSFEPDVARSINVQVRSPSSSATRTMNYINASIPAMFVMGLDCRVRRWDITNVDLHSETDPGRLHTVISDISLARLAMTVHLSTIDDLSRFLDIPVPEDKASTLTHLALAVNVRGHTIAVVQKLIDVIQVVAKKHRLIYLQLALLCPRDDPFQVRWSRWMGLVDMSSIEDINDMDSMSFNDEYSRHEEFCRELEQLNHRDIALQLFKHLRRLRFLSLSLHPSGEKHHWFASRVDKSIRSLPKVEGERYTREAGMDAYRDRFDRFSHAWPI